MKDIRIRKDTLKKEDASRHWVAQLQAALDPTKFPVSVDFTGELRSAVSTSPLMALRTPEFPSYLKMETEPASETLYLGMIVLDLCHKPSEPHYYYYYYHHHHHHHHQKQHYKGKWKQRVSFNRRGIVYFKVLPWIHLERLSKTSKNLSWDSKSALYIGKKYKWATR
jgi:hypothetical protein